MHWTAMPGSLKSSFQRPLLHSRHCTPEAEWNRGGWVHPQYPLQVDEGDFMEVGSVECGDRLDVGHELEKEVI